MRPAVSGPLGSFCAPGPPFLMYRMYVRPHMRQTARTAFTVCKAVMMARQSIRPSTALFPPPGRISQHKFQSHTQQTENSIMGLLLFSARATTFFCELRLVERCIFIPLWRRREREGANSLARRRRQNFMSLPGTKFN
jgi:hypothetical protein